MDLAAMRLRKSALWVDCKQMLGLPIRPLNSYIDAYNIVHVHIVSHIVNVHWVLDILY